LNGEADDLPENAFMYVGTIDEVKDKLRRQRIDEIISTGNRYT
jgi:F0F1-type ATP synthase beta subunit